MREVEEYDNRDGEDFKAFQALVADTICCSLFDMGTRDIKNIVGWHHPLIDRLQDTLNTLVAWGIIDEVPSGQMQRYRKHKALPKAEMTVDSVKQKEFDEWKRKENQKYPTAAMTGTI